MENIKEYKFIVDGMTCAACSSRAERVLLKLDGVKAANVNLTTAKAVVVYDEDKTDKEKIRVAIQKAGFSPLEIEKNDAEKEKEKTKKKSKEAEIKFFSALAFAIPLFYISMGSMLGMPIPSFMDMEKNPFFFALVQLLLVIPIMISGRKFYTVGVKTALHGSPNMDTLVAIGSGSAFVYSLYSLYLIIAKADAHAVHALYFESAGIIVTFILLGRMLEARSKAKTSQAIVSLMELAPKTAIIEKNSVEIKIDIEDIQIGDIVIIKPGMAVSVDGKIVSGSSYVDESMLTGESVPVSKKEGDDVFSGTLNKNGLLRVEVTKENSQTALSQIIDLIERTQATKAPVAKLADKISAIFVPAVMLIALVSALLWFFIAGEKIEFVLKIFVAVLVIACPCALGLATPTAIMAGTGKGAREGILIKSGEALEVAHKVDVVILDKTGTITNGKASVTDIISEDKEKLLLIAASAEQGSEHILGQAIVDFAKAEKIELKEAESFEAISGKGVSAMVDGESVLVGNEKIMAENDIDMAQFKEAIHSFGKEGKTPVAVALNGEMIGVIAVADTIKPNAKETIKKINNLGLEIVMLTGDNKDVARHIASQVGIETVFAQVMPTDKSEVVEKYKNQGKVVAMVGDGINDAPALTLADVGIAMGNGTDVAMESADIVLMNSDIALVYKAIELSKKTMRIIKQNLFWAFAYNSLGIPVAAGALHIFGGPLLSPMIAAAAMSLSSITVVSNSLRLKK